MVNFITPQPILKKILDLILSEKHMNSYHWGINCIIIYRIKGNHLLENSVIKQKVQVKGRVMANLGAILMHFME